MKTSAIVLSCSLAANAATVHAASCRPLEYAEMKDTTAKELVKTYCYYDGIARIHRDVRVRFNRLFLQQINRPGVTPGVIENLKREYLKNDAGEAADHGNCIDQQKKLATALKERRLTTPQCDASVKPALEKR